MQFIDIRNEAMGLIVLPQLMSKIKRFYREQIRTFFFGFLKFGHLYDNAYNSETV